MNVRERICLDTFKRVKRGELSVAKAARLLNVSERQGRRLWKRFGSDGDAGLVHGLRGRRGVAGNRSLGELRESAVAICREHYGDFGASLASEYLAKKHGLVVPRGTLWRWLTEAGLGGRVRRAVKHRSRRERRPCMGEMEQMDGSTHDWFEGRGAPCVVFVMIDDATNQVHMRFYASEDTRSAFDLVGRYAGIHGLPLSLYVDKDSIYRVNDEVAREKGRQCGREVLTQFGRAMKELGVKMIFADSPQAKGRVERTHGTMQDRLIKALRVEGISDIDSANRFLDERFLKEFNAQFTCPAATATDAHRRVPRTVKLAEVLCLQEKRVVSKDWCVSYAGRILQIDKKHERLALAGRKVTVLDLADGTLKVIYKEKSLSWEEVQERPKPPSKPRTLKERTPWRPGPNHPWNRSAVKPAPAPAAG